MAKWRQRAHNHDICDCSDTSILRCLTIHKRWVKYDCFGPEKTSPTKSHAVDKMRLPAAVLTPALVAHTSLAALYYPTPQAAFLEHILVDNWGAHASNFSSAITPCSNYVTEVGAPAASSGRTTAAQWMRVAFHDFVTADVGAGTGGVDASIGFETERGENSGSAFNDSFTFWAPFVNDAVSSKLASCLAG